QAELNLARIRECASNRGVRSDPIARSVKDLDVLLKSSGPVKVRPVENIESLGPKLDALHFRHRNVFHNRKIEVLQAGANDGIAPQVAVKPGLRQSEGAWIEVEVGSSQFRAGGDTWTAPGNACHRVPAEARKQIRAVCDLRSTGSVARTIKPAVDRN